jgi:CBS domain containing-hemolysin-like protein
MLETAHFGSLPTLLTSRTVSPLTWVVIVTLIAINAFYVAAEFGAVGVRRSRVRRMSGDGHALAGRLWPHIESPAGLNRYVAASQIGITVSSLVLGAYAQATLAVALAPQLASGLGVDRVAAGSTADVVVLVALAVAQAVLGELVPKTLALQFPTQIALATVLPMQWSLRVFRPFIAAVNAATGLLLRLMGSRPATERHLHSPDEIALLIAESRDGGRLEPDEQQRLHRALHLGLRSARDLMIPLGRLTMLAVDTPWEAVVHAVAASPFSHLPVYRGTPSQIIGMLRVKDLVRRFVTHGPTALAALVRPIAQVRADLPADRVISVLRERRTHQAVVTDLEHHVVGLITIQDVLVELVGKGDRV